MALTTNSRLLQKMDAESEVITAVNLLPANGDEAADAQTLIAQEEAAHGNDVQALSLDGAGWRGELLRTWQDPAGLNLEVFVPPPAPPPSALVFPAAMFTLDPTGTVLTCPGGQQTRKRRRTRTNAGWLYTFPTHRCQVCPLRQHCLSSPTARSGRAVVKNDYAAEYAAARVQAQTPAHAQVRRAHRAIERKLAEVVRWHGARRMRYRGRRRGLIQYLMTALVTNVKRMVRLLWTMPAAGGGPAGPAAAVRTVSCPNLLHVVRPCGTVLWGCARLSAQSPALVA